MAMTPAPTWLLSISLIINGEWQQAATIKTKRKNLRQRDLEHLLAQAIPRLCGRTKLEPNGYFSIDGLPRSGLINITLNLPAS